MRLLVLRFSAMGDVALLAPVLSALEKKYSNLSITLVTRKSFEAFFYNIPGVEVIGVDVDRDYRGLFGLYRLFRELKSLGPYQIGIDVHGSTRSRIIKFFFKFSGLRFESIVKGRREKIAQIRRRKKILNPLPHVIERYMHVFERAGFSADPSQGPWINPDTHSRALVRDFLNAKQVKKKENHWIGIAPFAGHEQKMWPLNLMKELISLIRQNIDCSIFLFGGGKEEIRQLTEIQSLFPESIMVAGNLNLEGEIALIMRLDVMIAMASSNMHLAALLGTRVLSIWGSTHPFSGFGPYGQDESSIVQIPTGILTCRPCSIYGNRKCFRGDLACLNWITPKDVYNRLLFILKHNEDIDNLPQTD